MRFCSPHSELEKREFDGRTTIGLWFNPVVVLGFQQLSQITFVSQMFRCLASRISILFSVGQLVGWLGLSCAPWTRVCPSAHSYCSYCAQVRHVKRARIEAKSTACGALCALEADIKAQKVDLAINEDDMEQSLLRKVIFYQTNYISPSFSLFSPFSLLSPFSPFSWPFATWDFAM